jgi:predicted N-acetyltransferase YhbS
MPSLTIRRLTPADIPAAADVLAAAFYASTWAEGLRLSMLLQPDGMLLAEEGGRALGVVGAVDYGPFAYVGMMGVHPAAQRRGVARALMVELLAWLDGRGCPLAVLDATPLGAPLYAQLGFVDAGRSYVAAAAELAPPAPLPAGVAPLAADELDALAVFDAPIFGANRGRLLAELTRSPARTLVARDPVGAIGGYVIVQREAIGPWAARTPELAALLLRAALASGLDSPPRAKIPAGNPAAGELLAAAGIARQRELTHMRRGAGARPGDAAALYSLASFALG